MRLYGFEPGQEVYNYTNRATKGETGTVLAVFKFSDPDVYHNVQVRTPDGRVHYWCYKYITLLTPLMKELL